MKMKEYVYGPNMPRKRRLRKEKEQKLRAERMQAIEDNFERQAYASEIFVRKKILAVQKEVLDIAKKKYEEELETVKKSIKNKTK